ncbi:MAG: SRPBCC domain-containing protein [Nocardioidaceae bacterium]|nr:SRPBCC domain-containing protein [Nocardioidaceae bacterium]
MTVISTTTDTDALTLTLVAEFAAPVEQVWQVWADPRLLEAWYCPPEFPATFTTYEFEVGGTAEYHATGPDGTRYPAWWTITAIEAPHRLEYTDGFADADGHRLDDPAPTRNTVTLETIGTGTRMTLLCRFDSLPHLKQIEAMGQEEGLSQAAAQIDGLLARASAGSGH